MYTSANQVVELGNLYYDTIGYKTIYRGKYLSYECEHIVQSYSVDRIGKQYVIYIAYVQNHS